MQNKINSAHKLLDSEGKLIEAGWADTALLEYEPRSIKLNRMNMREWDRYIVVSASGEYALSMWLADKRSTGVVNACFYDLKNNKQYDCFLPVILPAARICMPRSVECGSVVYKDSFCEYMYLLTEGDRHLYCKYSKLFGCELEVNIHLGYEKGDSTLAVASPCSDDSKQFCYNIKTECMPVSGYVTVDSVRYGFNPETDFATLDWGRGVWTAQGTKRIWCTGSGIANGRRVGFNIGYGIGNMSQASENAVFIDGVCHKIGRVFIDIPIEDRRKEWIIRSDDKRFEAVILPDANFNSKHILGLKPFNEKVMLGRLSGTVVLENGETVTVNEIACFSEESVDKY
ncbi:MAG: DUF2804 domain-containing protein [Clostridia bacterium]|nr:DUF2804 domain-containing protein [Clostridia bacterium]